MDFELIKNKNNTFTAMDMDNNLAFSPDPMAAIAMYVMQVWMQEHPGEKVVINDQEIDLERVIEMNDSNQVELLAKKLGG